MSLWQLATRSLRHHWRIHVAVALGVAAATAVLSGALLVGDSVRGSLAELTFERLGRIDQVLVTDRFFRRELAEELAAEPGFDRYFSEALPAVIVQGTFQNPDAERQPRAGRVTVIGTDERFWSFDDGALGSVPWPAKGEVVLNQPLAEKLHARPGDEVLLRIGQVSQIPPDSPLGRKTETIRNQRLTVKAIAPAAGLGRFSLRPNQRLPLNAFVAIDSLQAALEQPRRANALVVAGKQAHQSPPAESATALQALLHPKLTDYGLDLARTKRGYFQLSSNRMLLDPAVEAAGMRAFQAEKVQPALTYLANWIKAGEGKIPYSTVTAIDLRVEEPLGPFVTPEGERIEVLADDQIVLNRWAADDLERQGVKLEPGQPVEITYFEPESTHGQVKESKAVFRLKAIVAMDGAAGDPDFTPELKGVTDKESIANWQPPFPYDPSRVRSTPPHDEDDAYWKEHKATPKAFISLAAGRKLWSSRFGNTTSLRIPASADATAETLATRLKLEPTELGFSFLPVKLQGLAASNGTTPFNLLFLGFSFFIMAAAVMLVALLFRLGIEQRAAQVGLAMAVGLNRRRVATWLAAEGLLVAALGALVGVAGGVGYAWLMLAALRSPRFWLRAVTTPFLEFYVSPASLAIGYASGVIVSLLTILWTLRHMRHSSIRQLLGGQIAEKSSLSKSPSHWGRRTAWGMLLAAVALGFAASQLGGEAQAGAFFGSGALVLAALLTLLAIRLRSGSMGSLTAESAYPLAQLAARNGARSPSRSTLTVGLVASAAFLIVAISAFHIDPRSAGIGRDSGSGGFALVAESDQPVYQDLNSVEGRKDLGIAGDAEAAWKTCQTISLRVQAGDDASCLNLYQPTQPRALGISPALVERGGFAWAGSAASTPEEKANPWLLLNKRLLARPDGAEPVPVVLDMNTAMYSLHLWKGAGETFEIVDGRGEKVLLQVVGLLQNSIFQGDLLISEQQLVKHFPDVSGYRIFLIDTPDEPTADLVGRLEEPLGDYGLAAQSTLERLDDFLAVQNTYLATFQSLGGLGLLLGTFGLATVQLRSVLERRGELALLRATGFGRSRLARLVMIENALLLVGGLAIGAITALVAVLPHLFGGGAAIPWLPLAATLGLVLVVGFLAGLAAVRATLRADLLPALRGE